MSKFCRCVLQKHCTVPAQHRSSHYSSASSDSGALDNNSSSYHIIYSPVVLKEQKCDEGWEKEGNWKVLVQGSNRRSVEGKKEIMLGLKKETQAASRSWESMTHADRDTLVAGTTSTLLGWTRTDESHVTTRSPMRNFPGVAPPAPQMHTIWMQNRRLLGHRMEAFPHLTEKQVLTTRETTVLSSMTNVIIWQNSPHKNTLISCTQVQQASFSAAPPLTCPHRFPPQWNALQI